MGSADRHDAAAMRPAEKLLAADEHQQQRDARYDLRHDKWRHDHAHEQGPPPEAPKAAERIAGQRADDGGAGGGNQPDLDREPGGAQNLAVTRQHAVPFRRKSGPDRDHRRGVEGIDHQRDDREVEEGEAGDQHRGQRHAMRARCHVLAASSLASFRFLSQTSRMIGSSRNSTTAVATADAVGQSRLLKNSSKITEAIN